MRLVLTGLAGVACLGTLVAQAPPENPPVPGAQKTRSEQEMRSVTAATTAFLATLTTEQRVKLTLPFDSDYRLDWHFVPRDRKGLSFGDMDEKQQKAALDLLKVTLSEQGYRKANGIRQLEAVLRDMEGAWRDPDRYVFTLFGTPGPTEPWGLRYEGHHISLNWTMAKGKVIGSSPQFFGANPARVLSGPRQGLRVLAAEEDLARTLVKSLDRTQRQAAVLSETAPPDILTGAQRQAAIQEDRGISYRALNKAQRGMLLSLIRTHLDAQPRSVAETRLARIRAAGMDTTKFAWMGGLEPGQGHYYRVQGTTFLIEYDNTQNQANHIHTVWRDFKGDFGRDLLAEHYKKQPHRQ